MQPQTLKDLTFVERFCTYPLLDSTNDTARAMTDLPRSGLCVVQADCQTRGRGRSGAVFFSDSTGGLWVSIITPVVSIEEHFAHNRALSLALCETVEAVCGPDYRCSIKWPNDIYLRDKKLCGILLENHPGNARMLVLGFGLNVAVHYDEFPEALKPIATSLLIETGNRYSRSVLLKETLERYHAHCATDPTVLHRVYTQRLYGTGCVVEIDGRRGTFNGVALDGRLGLRVGR
jgi:BirA family biotin operon repressor/biotin-[acetyl-CoA-carboxylase] ligase